MLNLKKIILTGPTGGVGMSLIHEMLSQNIDVTAICRPNSKRLFMLEELDDVHIVECDINNLLSLIGKLQPNYDAFYHFGWVGPFGDDRQNLKMQTANIQCNLDAVELASALGCKVFIGSGSQSEIGHVDGVLRPHMACNPDNGYGVAKLASGQITRLRCHQLGIRHEWARIVSMYGPWDRKYTMVMSSILKMLRGERVSFTKGDQIWDYIYNKDAAHAFRLIAERGVDGEIYLLGTGKTRQLKEYIAAIRDAINPNLEIGLGEIDYYPNQVMHLEADISNWVMDTGFQPKYSFEQGIRETVSWARNQLLMNTEL